MLLVIFIKGQDKAAMSKWKIEIHVGEPSVNEVFIARPWTDTQDNYEYIKSNILSAIAKAGLKATDTNYQKIDAYFMRSLVKQIRKAAVVIGVCSPGQNSGEPNPNVMYEIGFAQSIGKPTIIISSSEFVGNGVHAADLQGQDILTYDIVRKEKFDEKLARFIKNAVERSDSSGLIDKNSYDDIYAVPLLVEKKQSALAFAFPIIRFTTEILRLFLQENRQLDLIDRHTQILSQLSIETERERLLQSQQEIKRDWFDFIALEEAIVTKRIKKLIKEEDEIEKAIQELSSFLVDPEYKELLKELREDIRNIISHMNKYLSNLSLLKQQMNNFNEELMMLDKKDFIAKALNLGCSRLIEEVYSLTGLAGNVIPQTYQILDKLGDTRG